jgi:hypothetical protein
MFYDARSDTLYAALCRWKYMFYTWLLNEYNWLWKWTYSRIYIEWLFILLYHLYFIFIWLILYLCTWIYRRYNKLIDWLRDEMWTHITKVLKINREVDLLKVFSSFRAMFYHTELLQQFKFIIQLIFRGAYSFWISYHLTVTCFWQMKKAQWAHRFSCKASSACIAGVTLRIIHAR